MCFIKNVFSKCKDINGGSTWLHERKFECQPKKPLKYILWTSLNKKILQKISRRMSFECVEKIYNIKGNLQHWNQMQAFFYFSHSYIYKNGKKKKNSDHDILQFYFQRAIMSNYQLKCVFYITFGEFLRFTYFFNKMWPHTNFTSKTAEKSQRRTRVVRCFLLNS